MTDPLVLNVAELTRRPATRKAYELVVPAQGLTLGGGAHVEDGTVVVDVVVESLTDGLTVNGEIRTEWRDVPALPGSGGGRAGGRGVELYQVHPTSEDAFTFDGEQLDLGPMVRSSCSWSCLKRRSAVRTAHLPAVRGRPQRRPGDCGPTSWIRGGPVSSSSGGSRATNGRRPGAGR